MNGFRDDMASLANYKSRLRQDLHERKLVIAKVKYDLLVQQLTMVDHQALKMAWEEGTVTEAKYKKLVHKLPKLRLPIIPAPIVLPTVWPSLMTYLKLLALPSMGFSKCKDLDQ